MPVHDGAMGNQEGREGLAVTEGGEVAEGEECRDTIVGGDGII